MMNQSDIILMKGGDTMYSTQGVITATISAEDIEQLKIVDNEGFELKVTSNYGSYEETKGRYEKDKDLDCIFMGINSVEYGELCVALTIGQLEQLAQYSSKIVKYFKDNAK